MQKMMIMTRKNPYRLLFIHILNYSATFCSCLILQLLIIINTLQYIILSEVIDH